MNVEDIDPVCLELSQAIPQRHEERSFVIARMVERVSFSHAVGCVGRGKLGGNDHAVSIALLLHPFAYPALGLFILIVV